MGVGGISGVAKVGWGIMSNGFPPILGIGLSGLDRNGSTPALRAGIPNPDIRGGGTLEPFVPEILSEDPSVPVVSVTVPSVVVVVKMSEPLLPRLVSSRGLGLGGRSGGSAVVVCSSVGSCFGIKIPGNAPALPKSPGIVVRIEARGLTGGSPERIGPSTGGIGT